MAVYIFEPDAFDKICQVEGPEYLENQKNFGTYGFAAFKEQWEEKISKYPDIKDEGRDLVVTMKDGNSVIYGYLGLDRYLVYYSGEIVFIELQAINKEAIRRAKEVGFRID